MSRNRYQKERDGNEQEIVDALQAIGCTVQRLDVPVDLLVGYQARNFLMEIKMPGKEKALTKLQEKFIPEWHGQVRVVTTVDEAIRLVTRAYR
jgi:hypothetical protein